MTTRTEAPTDAELLAEMAAGGRAGLDELYRRHAGWLHLRLSRRCADRSLVEEALQDTFLTAWRNAGRYSGEGEVGAWLWGIGIRQLMNHMRPRKTLAWHLLHRSDRVVSAEDEVLVGVEHGDLGSAIDRLSLELRAVVQATTIDGLTTSEAARLLGIPSGTVKTRMMRAKRELREAMA